MKITKVKLNNKPVVMQRDNNEGYLLHADQAIKKQQITELIAQKRANFEASIIGKTLVRETTFNNKKDDDKKTKEHNKQQKDNLKTLKQLFEHTLNPDKVNAPDNLDDLKKLNKTDLKEYLAHKFAEDKPLLYNQKKYSFNLLDDLYTCLQQDNKHVASYRQWADWFITNKRDFLAKSIINNSIKTPNRGTPSKRFQVLAKLAEQMVNNYKLDVDALYSELAPVIKQWQICLDTAEKYTQNDIDNPALKDKHKLLGYPKDFFEFKRALKKALTEQQRKLYQEGKFANLLLEQYSLELTKYLARYFPLKKSARQLTLEDINYYLQAETVQQTIAQQLKNATMQHLLQQGKLISYQLDQKPQVTSQDLQRIKIEEAFAMQLISACAFAASNLRNVIDPSVKDDILTQKEFINTLKNVLANPKQKNEGIHRLTQFLFSQTFDFETNKVVTNHQEIIQKLKENDQYLGAVNTICSAIYAIRNHVIHFQHNALASIFSMEEFTPISLNSAGELTVSDEPVKFNQTGLLVEWFEHELANLEYVFAEKIRTSGILDFYKITDIIKYVDTVSLNSKPLAFVPGFKKVFNWGVTYQTEQTDYLKLTHYFQKTYSQSAKHIEFDKAYQARYNLLGLIYEHKFIQTFLNEPQAFKQAVDDILAANKKRAEEKPKKADKQKQGFKEIAPYEACQTPTDYLKGLQSELMNDENKKREEGKLAADQTGHYQQFIWQLFVKGFDNFLTSHSELAFINTPTLQFDDSTKQQSANEQHSQVEQLKNALTIAHQIDTHQSSHIAFWLFCKMLDANYLNQLHNQFSKWQQAQQAITTTLNKDIEVFQQIISFSLLTSDITPAGYQDIYKDKADYFEELQPFTQLKQDKLTKKIDLFVQSDGTPIIHGAIEQAKKYATRDVLIKLLEQNIHFKISAKDIDDWERLLKETHPQNPAKLSNIRQQLHLEWVKAAHKTDSKKNRLDKQKTVGWLNSPCQLTAGLTNGAYYQDLCHKLDEYNWLDNKVHLIYIRKLHNLLIDILARLAGFTNLLERDFQFLDQGASYYRKDDNYRLIEWVSFHDLLGNSGLKALDAIFDNVTSQTVEGLIANYNQQQISELKVTLQNKREFYKACFFSSKPNVFETRNFIAHFNYLGKINDKKAKSILELLAEVCSILSYDRKLKNAVAKSFIDLMDRHGIIIKFKPLYKHGHSFEIAEIKSKYLVHLGGAKIKTKEGDYRAITTPQHQQHYIDMVRALLELKG